MFDLERHFSGRIVALDRAAWPALAQQAALRAGDATPDQLVARAASFDEARRGPGYQQVGRIGVVSITGLITSDAVLLYLLGGTHPDAVVRGVRAAGADPDVASILLLVDSPGGTVDLVPEAAAAIREARAGKGVTTIARSQMHSAAYWLGAQGSPVVATPSAAVGSLGVFTVHYDYSAFNARIGVLPTYVTSSPEKVEGNSDEPLGEAARTHLQRRVDEVFAQFVRDVSLGRRVDEAVVRRTYGNGRSVGAAEAVRRGVVDRVGRLEDLLPPAPPSRAAGGRPALTRDEEAALLAAVVAAEG